MSEYDEELPYVFDLMYDIKTKQELVDEMSDLEARLKGLQNLIESQGVDLSGVTPIPLGRDHEIFKIIWHDQPIDGR